MAAQFTNAVKSVDWNGNVAKLCSDAELCERIEECNRRIAVWGQQLESVDSGNPALPFVREMQFGGHNVASCVALALYKPAAACMRSLVECALYYVYFRTHPSELESLVRVESYYVTKKDILKYLEIHAREFQPRQLALGYKDRLEKWYSKTSAIVHGQIPGQWSNAGSVSAIKHDKSMLPEVVTHFETAAQLAQDTFMCALGTEVWKFFANDAKTYLRKGISGPIKAVLKLGA